MALPAFRVAQVDGGAAPTTREYVTSAAQTFSRGDVVRLLAAGTVSEAVDDETTALGIAAADADVGNPIPVIEFVAGMVFSAANSGDAFAVDDKGDLCSLNVAAGTHTVVVGTAGNGLFKIIGNDATDSSRVLVACVSAQSQAPSMGAVAAPD